MKIIPVQYECDICGSKYKTQEEALECEAKKAPMYEIGTIYGDHTNNDIYCDITFAVAYNEEYHHYNRGGSWACRNNHYGDSLGEHKCGFNSLSLNEYNGKVDINHPTFKRMVAWLKSQNIPIKIWNGKEAVPYVEE